MIFPERGAPRIKSGAGFSGSCFSRHDATLAMKALTFACGRQKSYRFLPIDAGGFCPEALQGVADGSRFAFNRSRKVNARKQFVGNESCLFETRQYTRRLMIKIH